MEINSRIFGKIEIDDNKISQYQTDYWDLKNIHDM